jgi:dihydroorotate dehydrogenase
VDPLYLLQWFQRILGGGGVITPADAKEFLSAGADVVQVATIALTNPLFAYEYSKK